jgi:hypothetical protein
LATHQLRSNAAFILFASAHNLKSREMLVEGKFYFSRPIILS